MSGPNDWNPEDGPPPTDEELRESAELERALASAIAAPHNSSGRVVTGTSGETASTMALVDTALRAHATAHAPSKESVDAVVRGAVAHAVQRRGGGSLGARRWLVRVTAAAAVLIGGVVGARAINQRSSHGTSSALAPITRSVDDVFTAAIGNDPGSDPISRIESSRMRDFRGNLFARGGRAR